MSRAHTHTHSHTLTHAAPIPPPATRTRRPPPAILCVAHRTSQGGQCRGSTASQRGQAGRASTKPSHPPALAPSKSPPDQHPLGPAVPRTPPSWGAELPPLVPAIYNAGGSQAWIWLLRPRDEPVGTGTGAVSQAELGRTQPDTAQGSGCLDPGRGVHQRLGRLHVMGTHQSRGSPRLLAHTLG